MDTGIVALLIPVMALSIPIFAIVTHHRRKVEEMRLEAARTANGAQGAQDSARVQMLEDRVAVLERIVTDRSYDVASQIDALRDDRQASGAALDLEKRR